MAALVQSHLMRNQSIRESSKQWVVILALVLVVVAPARLVAQQSPFAAALKSEMIQPLQPSPYVQKIEPVERQHRFWDRENTALFAGVAGMSAADFCVTRANLASGGRELNPVTRVLSGSTAGLAVNFAGETAGYIGISYLFHKTGHHALERMTSFVNIGASAGAVAYGLAHR
jgi:hypothetical protein